MMRVGRTQHAVVWVLSAMLCSGALLDHQALPARATGPDGVTYVHDPAGRLVGVVDPATDTAVYSYDEVGNVTSIQRHPSSQISLIDFAPRQAPIGRDVSIYGSAFSPIAAQDSVTINGAAAQIISAAASKIVARVPSGATSGVVTVTSPSGTAASTASLLVVGALAPSIGGVDQTVVAPGQSLVISGANFDASAPEANNVLVGGTRAQVTAVSATTLTVEVPITGSGRVSVATAAGVATGTTDVYVIPPEHTTDQLAATGRADPGVLKTVSLPTPNKIGLVLFEGVRGQRISLRFGPMDFMPFCWCNVAQYLLSPYGSVLYGASPGNGVASVFMEPITLPATGTYSWFVNPLGVTGTFSFTYWVVPPDAVSPIGIDGVPVTIGNTVPGQNFQLTFDGTAGQNVSMYFQHNTVCNWCMVDTSIVDPAGSTWLAFSFGNNNESPFFEPRALPATGSYRIYMHIRGGGTGAVRVTIWPVAGDVTGTIRLDGTPVLIGPAVPGQNLQLTFDGSQDRRVSMRFEHGTVCNWCVIDVTVYDPNQAIIRQFAFGTNNESVAFDPQALPASGQYRILMHIRGGGLGSVRVFLWDVTDDATASTTIDGVAAQLDVGPGQSAQVTFAGGAGQQVVLHKTANYCCPAATLKDSTGDVLYGPNSAQNFNTPTLTLNGNSPFTLFVAPQGSNYGHLTVSVTSAGGGSGGGGRQAPGRPGASSEISAAAPPSQPSGATSQPLPAAEASAAPVQPALTSPAGASVSARPQPPETDLTPQPPAGEAPVPSDADIAEDAMAAAAGAPSVQDPAASAGPRAPPAADSGTSISGQVRRIDGSPLAHVTLKVADQVTQTGRDGQFLLRIRYASQHITMLIDGRTATREGRSFGTYEVRVDVVEGQTTVLPYVVWMTRIDWQHAVHFQSPNPREVVVTTPRIPGFELHIPAGSVITGMDGHPVTELSITPIPVDKPPYPLPGPFPMYFTVQPGGAYVSPKGAFFVYPNQDGSAPGSTFTAWNYDPDEKGWYPYGQFRVAADGRRIVPDEGAVVYEFTGESVLPGLLGALFSWLLDTFKWATGDPVDPGTGLFGYSRTDMSLPDTIPVDISRTYRQLDDTPRGFGPGSGLQYQMSLNFVQPWQRIDLVFSDSSRVHFHRVGPDHDYYSTFVNNDSPGQFYKARLTFNGGFWEARLVNGTTYLFGNPAFLIAIRDRDNNQLSVIRSPSRPQDIIAVTSPNGRTVRFSYAGTSGRIAQAKDNLGRTVVYQYDGQNRLWKVTDAAQGVQEYTYEGTSNRMSTLKDARGIVYLTNEYNVGGALAGTIKKQTQADQTTYQFAYTVQANKIVRTEVTDPRNTVSRYDFNADGYVTTVTAALNQAEQQVTQIERAPTSGRIQSVTDQLGRKTSFA